MIVLCLAVSLVLHNVTFAAEAPAQQMIQLEGRVTCTAPNERHGAAINVVNDYGINEDGNHSFEHWDGEGGGLGMWITDAGGGGSAANNPAGLDCSTWLRFDFDTVYSLGVMWIWNHNQWRSTLDETNRGLKNVQVHYTSDNQIWIKLGEYVIPRMAGADWVAHNFEIDFAGVDANSVLITASPTEGNHGSPYYGLSEVMFGIDGTVYDPYSKRPREASIPRNRIVASASTTWPDLNTVNLINGEPETVNFRQTNSGGWWHGGGDTTLTSASVDPNDTVLSPAWIRFDFDEAYALGDMWIWNMNQPGLTGRGLKKVHIHYYDGSQWYRLMNGAEECFILNRAGDEDPIEHTNSIDFGGAVATVVAISADPNGGMWGDPSADPYYGLSEVLFGIAHTMWTPPGAPEIVLPAEDAVHDTRITATASSMYGTPQHPQKTVNGEGLDWRTLLHDNHGSAETMWHASNNADTSSAHPNTAIGSEWIRYDFDKSYPLGTMWVWNLNQVNNTSRGLKKVYIEFSNDGQNWSRLMDGANDYFILDQASGEDDLQYTTAINFGGADANSVVITADVADGNWGGAPYIGLSEVRFGVFGTTYRGHPGPAAGDFDDDFDVDLDDFGILGGEWLVDNSRPADEDYILDDFESYDVVDPNLFTKWMLVDNADVDGHAALLTEGLDAHAGSQAMRLTWQEIVDDRYVKVLYDANDIINPGLPDLSNYDQFRMWIFRHDYDHQIITIDPLDEQGESIQHFVVYLYPDSVDLPYGQWSEIVLNLSYDSPLPVSGFMIGATTDFSMDSGTIDIDDIRLVDLPECNDLTETDLTGDCKVNLLDLAVMAGNWLKGTVLLN